MPGGQLILTLPEPTGLEREDAVYERDYQTVAQFLNPIDAHLVCSRLWAAGVQAYVADANLVQTYGPRLTPRTPNFDLTFLDTLLYAVLPRLEAVEHSQRASQPLFLRLGGLGHKRSQTPHGVAAATLCVRHVSAVRLSG